MFYPFLSISKRKKQAYCISIKYLLQKEVLTMNEMFASLFSSGISWDSGWRYRKALQYAGIHRICTDFNSRDHCFPAGAEYPGSFSPGNTDAWYYFWIYSQYTGFSGYHHRLHGCSVLRKYCRKSDCLCWFWYKTFPAAGDKRKPFCLIENHWQNHTYHHGSVLYCGKL